MSKQTAVEWLVEQMIKYELVPKGIHFNNVLFHQAKAMEREQIIEAHMHMRCIKTDDPYECSRDAVYQSAQYYNSTYKGGEQ